MASAVFESWLGRSIPKKALIIDVINCTDFYFNCQVK